MRSTAHHRLRRPQTNSRNFGYRKIANLFFIVCFSLRGQAVRSRLPFQHLLYLRLDLRLSIMNSKSITLHVACSLISILATSPPENSNEVIELFQSPNINQTSNLTNLSASAVSANKRFVTCDGAAGLDISDCMDAIGYLPFDSKPMGFAEREVGKVPLDVMPLPFRRMGSECAFSENMTFCTLSIRPEFLRSVLETKRR